MTTGKYNLQINWPSGRHTSVGDITDEQYGEIARILSPEWPATPHPPAAQIAELVEALGWIADHGYGDGGRECADKARAALAKYKEQGE